MSDLEKSAPVPKKPVAWRSLAALAGGVILFVALAMFFTWLGTLI
jgi:hypothetical protein